MEERPEPSPHGGAGGPLCLELMSAAAILELAANPRGTAKCQVCPMELRPSVLAVDGFVRIGNCSIAEEVCVMPTRQMEQ